MKKIIVKSLELLMGLIFFVIVTSGIVAGSIFGSMAIGSAAVGVTIGAAGGIIVAVMITGIVYVLISIDDRLRELNEKFGDR